jgi:hypothetical protein
MRLLRLLPRMEKKEEEEEEVTLPSLGNLRPVEMSQV